MIVETGAVTFKGAPDDQLNIPPNCHRSTRRSINPGPPATNRWLGPNGNSNVPLVVRMLRAVETKQRLVQRSVVRVAVVHRRAVRIVFAQGSAPCVGGRTGDAVRQPFCELNLERVVRGTAWIRDQRHTVELRIAYKKILREQTAVPDKPAALTCNARAAVQKVGEAADVAVSNKRSSACECAQGCRSCHRSAVYDSSSGDVESLEHLIKQGRVASGLRGIERAEEVCC